MEAEKIDVGVLLKQGFIDALGKTSTLKVVGDDEPADAQIQLTVAEWGFRLTQGFSSVIYPTLNVVAQMNRGDEMIWRTSEAVTPFNGQNVFLLGDNRNNSNDSRFMGQVAVEDVVGKVTGIWFSNERARIGTTFP